MHALKFPIACTEIHAWTTLICAFREVYNTARKIKEKQDAYCLEALDEGWNSFGDFPEEPEWEALVDILRGRVKVNQAIFIII